MSSPNTLSLASYEGMTIHSAASFISGTLCKESNSSRLKNQTVVCLITCTCTFYSPTPVSDITTMKSIKRKIKRMTLLAISLTSSACNHL